MVVISAPGAKEVELTHEDPATEWSGPAQLDSAIWFADLVERDLTGPGFVVDGVPGTSIFKGSWPR